jgi:hypothetical protein
MSLTFKADPSPDSPTTRKSIETPGIREEIHDTLSKFDQAYFVEIARGVIEIEVIGTRPGSGSSLR